MKAPGNTAQVSMGLSFMGGFQQFTTVKMALQHPHAASSEHPRVFNHTPASKVYVVTQHSLPVPLHPHPLYAALLLVKTKTKDHDSNTLHV